jgi:hypothetical protein
VRTISLVSNAVTILLLSFWIPNNPFPAEPSSKSMTSAQTIPSASKIIQTRFVSTSKTSECFAALLSAADPFFQDGEIRVSE